MGKMKKKKEERSQTLTDRNKMTGYIYYLQKLPGILLTNLNCGNLRFFRLQCKHQNSCECKLTKERKMKKKTAMK